MKLLLLLLALLATRLASAQTPDWHAAQTLPTISPNCFFKESAVDAAGNVYLTGCFSGDAILGDTTLHSTGEMDGFILKWDRARRRVAWVRQATGPGTECVWQLVVQAPYIYVLGGFDRSPSAFGQPLRDSGRAEAYLARLTDHATRATIDWVQPLAVDQVPSGARQLVVHGRNIYLAGNTYALLGPVYGSTPERGPTAGDFIAKLTDQGRAAYFAWLYQQPAPSHNHAVMALAMRGRRVYLATTTWERYPLVPPPPGGRPQEADGFGVHTCSLITCLEDEGPAPRRCWQHPLTGQIHNLAAADHRLYVVGAIDEPNAFGPALVTTTNSNPKADMFVARLEVANTTARFQWVQRLGGPGYNGHTEMTLVATRGRHLVVAGNFDSSQMAFGAHVLTNANVSAWGTADMFVAHLTDAGATVRFDWAQRAGGPTIDGASAVALRGRRVYFVGHFYAAPSAFGTHPVTVGFHSNGTPGWAWLRLSH
jgi:hypothetical protein